MQDEDMPFKRPRDDGILNPNLNKTISLTYLSHHLVSEEKKETMEDEGGLEDTDDKISAQERVDYIYYTVHLSTMIDTADCSCFQVRTP